MVFLLVSVAAKRKAAILHTNKIIYLIGLDNYYKCISSIGHVLYIEVSRRRCFCYRMHNLHTYVCDVAKTMCGVFVRRHKQNR